MKFVLFFALIALVLGDNYNPGSPGGLPKSGPSGCSNGCPSLDQPATFQDCSTNFFNMKNVVNPCSIAVGFITILILALTLVTIYLSWACYQEDHCCYRKKWCKRRPQPPILIAA